MMRLFVLGSLLALLLESCSTFNARPSFCGMTRRPHPLAFPEACAQLRAHLGPAFPV